MAAWTADAVHFTADAIDHTADGYHLHGAVIEDGDVGLGRRKRQRYNLAQLMHEDELMLDMIKRFMRMQ